MCAHGAPASLGPEPGPLTMLNAYYLQEEAARTLRRGEAEPAYVEETLAKAAALGARVVRAWAFNDSPEKAGDSAIQTAPLQYDETSFRGLDLVLSRARAYGLRLVLALGNNWDDYGGARQYVEWARLPSPATGDARFFTERAVVEHYKEHVRRVLERVNTRDGWRYGAHPAVLAWELLNEPRRGGADRDGSHLRAWVDEVGALVKSLAPQHLVATGEEGFDVSVAGRHAAFWARAAPTRLFAGSASFRLNLASPYVDAASVHFWPEAWGIRPDDALEAGVRWISEAAAMAREVGKPLLVGEFGLRNDGVFDLEQRRDAYSAWLRCAVRAGAGAVGPWLFAYDERPDAWDRQTFYFLDGTSPGDPRNRYADVLVRASGPMP